VHDSARLLESKLRTVLKQVLAERAGLHWTALVKSGAECNTGRLNRKDCIRALRVHALHLLFGIH
jgi:hypothetical protein